MKMKYPSMLAGAALLALTCGGMHAFAGANGNDITPGANGNNTAPGSNGNSVSTSNTPTPTPTPVPSATPGSAAPHMSPGNATVPVGPLH